MRRLEPEPGAMGNVRDVGCSTTAKGARVRRGVLFRSDAPLAGDAPPPLEPWPPHHIVDLRSAGEAGAAPHPLAIDGTTVINRPLLTSADPLKMVAAAEEHTFSLHSVYADLIRLGGPVIAEIAALVGSSDGPVLVHCAAGKDRTGVTVAVLLAAAGASAEQIIADYVVTEQNVDAITARLAASWPAEVREERLRLLTAHAEMMSAPRGAIAAVLDTLDAWPGGAAGWLRDHGVSDAELEQLRARLIDD